MKNSMETVTQYLLAYWTNQTVDIQKIPALRQLSNRLALNPLTDFDKEKGTLNNTQVEIIKDELYKLYQNDPSVRTLISKLDPSIEKNDIHQVINIEGNQNQIIQIGGSGYVTQLPDKNLFVDKHFVVNDTLRKKNTIQLIIRISEHPESKIIIHASSPETGEVSTTRTNFFSDDELEAILSLVEYIDWQPGKVRQWWSVLEKLGLIENGEVIPNYKSKIGYYLYQILFPGPLENSLKTVYNIARMQHKTIQLDLFFPEGDTLLCRYPWEILYNGDHFLVGDGFLEIIRRIEFPEAYSPIKSDPPWHLLFVAPRPVDQDDLPEESERQLLEKGLGSLVKEGLLQIDVLESPVTYDNLLDHIDKIQFLHFDGHGAFGRLCSKCENFVPYYLNACRKCREPVTANTSGYLVFEKPNRGSDLVNISELRNVLSGSQVRFVMLTACQSGMSGIDTQFAGVGPGIIRAGIPAVVAMQFSVTVTAAQSFNQAFYRALGEKKSLSSAVTQGRKKMFRNGQAFFPCLYLRSIENTDNIFE